MAEIQEPALELGACGWGGWTLKGEEVGERSQPTATVAAAEDSLERSNIE